MNRSEKKFYTEISKILRTGRKAAYDSITAVMVETYWQLGKRIVEEEQKGEDRAEYGEYLIENLSRFLGDNFGKGFSEANLRNFRQFYLTFPIAKIRYTL
jgi:hypothetical protein